MEQEYCHWYKKYDDRRLDLIYKSCSSVFSTMLGDSRKTPNCAFSQKQINMTARYILPEMPFFSPPKARIKR